MSPHTLYRPQELAFRTQYAELKERAGSAGSLLYGTPGTLVKREGTGYAYWYRVYYPVPGRQAQQLVGRDGDVETLESVERQIEWNGPPPRSAIFESSSSRSPTRASPASWSNFTTEASCAQGVTLVGTLCYMAWLDASLAPRRFPLGRRRSILPRREKAWPWPCRRRFIEAMEATRLDFAPVPGMPSQSPSTSVKQKGRDGLRVDVLTHGDRLGKTVPIPQLMWSAQTVPHYAYLLDEPRQAALLAGGHCIPLMLPQPERFVWHKLFFSSTSRQSFPEKAEKDLVQAATLAAVLVEQHDEVLSDSFSDAPPAVRRAVKKRVPALRRALAAHPQALEQFEALLG